MSNLVKQYFVTNESTPKMVANKNKQFEDKVKEIEELRKEHEANILRQKQFVANMYKSADQDEEEISSPMPDVSATSIEEEAGTAEEAPVMEQSDGFVQGIEALEVETAETQKVNTSPNMDDEEAIKERELIIARAKSESYNIIDEAKAEAEKIIADAHKKAKELFEENKKLGYEEGSNDKLEEVMRMKEKLEATVEDKKNQLEQDYKQKEDVMERDIIDALVSVFDRVFHIQFDDKKELLLHLIKNTLMNVEVGKEFRIHVAQNNYKFLLAHLGDVRERVGNDVEIEIVNDANLDSSDCQIETSYGIFDCGIDMELSNLVKDIKSLCS